MVIGIEYEPVGCDAGTVCVRFAPVMSQAHWVSAPAPAVSKVIESTTPWLKVASDPSVSPAVVHGALTAAIAPLVGSIVSAFPDPG